MKRKSHLSTRLLGSGYMVLRGAETVLTRGRRQLAERVVGVEDQGSLCPRVPAYQRGAQGCGSGGLPRCRFNNRGGGSSPATFERCGGFVCKTAFQALSVQTPRKQQWCAGCRWLEKRARIV